MEPLVGLSGAKAQHRTLGDVVVQAIDVGVGARARQDVARIVEVNHTLDDIRVWNMANSYKNTGHGQHLFAALGLRDTDFPAGSTAPVAVGRGAVTWIRQSPVPFALSAAADARLAKLTPRP